MKKSEPEIDFAIRIENPKSKIEWGGIYGFIGWEKGGDFRSRQRSQYCVGDFGGVARRGRGAGFYFCRRNFGEAGATLAEGIGSKIILPCDVTKDEEIEKVFATLKQEWGGLDIMIHAIAFANKEDLSNPYVQTSRAGFIWPWT